MPVAQVYIGQIVRAPRGGAFARGRRWAPAAGQSHKPIVWSPPPEGGPYRAATGYEQFRRKVLTARPFAYRAAMDRPFPDPGLRVTEATERMLPPAVGGGRYRVPHPGRRALLKPAYFTAPEEHGYRLTLSAPTGYYTASEEALGLGDPGFLSKVFKGVKKAVGIIAAPIAATGILGKTAKKTARSTLKVVGAGLQIVAPALSFIPGVGPLAAAGAAAVGQVATSWGKTGKPFTFLHKPLAPLAQIAGSALVGPTVGMVSGFLPGGAPTGSVAAAGDVPREYGEDYGAVPAPAPGPIWGGVAQTVGQVATAALPVASQLLQRYLPAPDVAAVPVPEIIGPGGVASPGWPQPPEFSYVPGSVGSPGAPWEAPPAMAPEMVQAGLGGGGMMMPLLLAGGLVLLLARR